MLLRLVSGLQRQGYESTVVALNGRNELGPAFDDIGVPVVSLAMKSAWGALAGMAALRRIVETLRPDVLQGWMYHANLALSLVGQTRAKRPSLVWNIRRGLDDIHSLGFSTSFLVRASARLSARPSRIIYCTDRSRVQHESIGYKPSKSIVFDNGFDSERFRANTESRAKMRKTLCIPDDHFVIGCVGRYNKAKGHEFLLKAFEKVLAENSSAYLVLVGRGAEYGNRELVAKLRESGIASHVILLGEHARIEEVYPLFDVYCSSSVAEGFPNVVGEAMLCEVPCVVTDTGASRRMVEGIGFIVPPSSADALAEALLAASRLSFAERTKIGQEGRKRIADGYSLDRVVAGYSRLYDQIASCSEAP